MSHRAAVVGVFLTLAAGLACLATAEYVVPPASDIAVSERGGATTAREGPVAVPEPTEKALDYYRSGNVLWVVQVLWSLLVPAALVFTGFSARLRTLAQRVGRKWLFVVVVYSVLFLVISFLLDLPLAYYSEFVRQHAYGLSNQTLGKWAGDAVKSLLVSLVVMSIVIPVMYLFLKKSPNRWWLWTSLAAVPFIVLMLLVSPIWIDPLFNKFGPMQDRALETEILALADRAGIAGSRVFEVDKSVDTKAVNAYVTGFGQSKRIVLWDTIIAKLERPELLFVMGHEMGHYVLGHVPKSIAFFSLLILATLYAAHRTAGGVMRRWRARIGFSELADVASLPLILLLASLFSLVVTPVTMAYSRWQERQCDRFGLELTHDNHAAATAFVKLQAENLGNPRPGWLYKLWRSSHPPIGERIDFCNSYRPWQTGQPQSYERLIKAPATIP